MIKHFLMLIKDIREQIWEGTIELTKISTDDNIADIIINLIVGKQLTMKAMQVPGKT